MVKPESLPKDISSSILKLEKYLKEMQSKSKCVISTIIFFIVEEVAFSLLPQKTIRRGIIRKAETKPNPTIEKTRFLVPF